MKPKARYPERIALAMPPLLLAAVERIARENETTISEIVRQALRAVVTAEQRQSPACDEPAPPSALHVRSK
jgi:metal-responsive CopG/Arc/MetJ family transcriptional regulator